MSLPNHRHFSNFLLDAFRLFQFMFVSEIHVDLTFVKDVRVLLLFLEVSSSYLLQAGFDFAVLLPLTYKNWDCRHEPPYLACRFIFIHKSRLVLCTWLCTCWGQAWLLQRISSPLRSFPSQCWPRCGLSILSVFFTNAWIFNFTLKTR